jgi:hypothetical protein
MRVDPLDKTLICQSGDLKNVLRLHQEGCVLPSEIELGLLKVIFEDVGTEPYGGDSVEEACLHLPQRVLHRCVAEDQRYFSIAGDYTGNSSPICTTTSPQCNTDMETTFDQLDGNVPRATCRMDVARTRSVPVGIVEFYRRPRRYSNIDFSLEFCATRPPEEFLELTEKTSPWL